MIWVGRCLVGGQAMANKPLKDPSPPSAEAGGGRGGGAQYCTIKPIDTVSLADPENGQLAKYGCRL